MRTRSSHPVTPSVTLSVSPSVTALAAGRLAARAPRLLRSGAIVLAVLVLAACASTPVPSETMAVAAAAVARASSAGTGELAPNELRIAVDKMAAARAALAAGDNDHARRLAEQAELDAQVAVMMAQAARSTAAAKESEEAARVLREELNRKTGR
jgi:hypothetical protein